MNELSSGEVLAGSDSTDLLCFQLGTERFALPLSSVLEVIDGACVDSASIGAPLGGVLRVRDELVPVHSLRAILCASLLAVEPFALLLRNDMHRIAVLVDAAESALGVDLGGLCDLPEFLTRDRIVTGALRIDGRWTALLDADALVDALLAEGQHTVPGGAGVA